ncbi:MAG TPA: YdeI/OmpD-associated family protein [Acidimicrobiia bacterium]|nr:YdeI/OmpD-associated family protein [Acidimicrobiia bacterium]
MIEAAKASGSWTMLDDVEALIVPDDLELALSEDERARRHFDAFPRSAKKQILYWIKTARRAETRERRIADTVRLAALTIPAHLRSALEHRDPKCIVPTCEARRDLQIDHRQPWAAGGPTTLENTARLCRWHHYQKSHLGYRYRGGPGTWE